VGFATLALSQINAGPEAFFGNNCHLIPAVYADFMPNPREAAA